MPKSSEKANVIFVPHGGMAHVYVANDAETGADDPDWMHAPSLGTLRSVVNKIGNTNVRLGAQAPVTDILVRVPGLDPQQPFEGSEYRVLARDFWPACAHDQDPRCVFKCGPDEKQPCTLEVQLDPISVLAERQVGGEPLYSAPEVRINAFISANTGDIILLANSGAGYCFEDGARKGTHGSLTAADGLVPLAVSYPGATSRHADKDNLLLGVMSELQQGGWPIVTPTEARVIETFFGVGHGQEKP